MILEEFINYNLNSWSFNKELEELHAQSNCCLLCQECKRLITTTNILAIWPLFVGDDGTSKEASSGTLMKESENVYALWCSGRTCVEGMLVELKFLKRQDLISSISNMLKPSSDQIVSICISNHWDGMGFIYIGTWIALYETISNMLKPFSDQILSTCISKHWDWMGFIYIGPWLVLHPTCPSPSLIKL